MSDFGATSYPCEPPPTQDEKTWAMVAHLSALVGYVIPCGNLIAPLVVWAMKKDQSPFVARHAIQCLAFQAAVWVAIIISIPLMFICIGYATALLAAIASLAYMVLGTIRANEGKVFEYPLVGSFGR